jgi:DNA-binding NtrC family response regulator
VPKTLKVLVTENEWIIRLTFAEYLAEAGYEVVEAGTAEDALAILEKDPATLTALVTDVRLGGRMDGLKLAHHAALRWPWIKLLVVSAETPLKLATAPVSCGVMRKPVDMEEVVAKVQTLTGKP